MTYRIRIDTTEPAEGEATVSVDKIITQDVLRAVLVAMMQAETYQEWQASWAKQQEEEQRKRRERISQLQEKGQP